MEGPEDLEHLVARSKAGDQEALGTLAEKIGAILRTRLRFLGMDWVDAEQTAEECVERIVLRLRTYKVRSKGSFLGWCYKIAGNAFASWYRGGKRSGVPSLQHVPEPADEARPDHEETALGQAVWRAFDSLSATDREIIMLRHFQPASSFGEIGHMLGIGEGTARARHKRARDHLAALLKEEPTVLEWLMVSSVTN